MERSTVLFAKNTDELNSYIKSSPSANELYLSSVTNLDKIDSFHNLQMLKISAFKAIELNSDIKIDASSIKKLEKLKTLYIENDDHIEELSLPCSSNLDTLFISSCHILRYIGNLNQQNKLRNLVIYDVPNLDKGFYSKLIGFLDNSILDRVILDINTYTLFTDEELEKLKEYHVLFAEKIGIRDNYIFTPKMMEDFHSRILEIYKKVHDEYKDLYKILLEYYDYVRNTHYDEESLTKRQKFTLDGGKFYKYSNRYKSINSSYKALMKNNAVCEGYVNLLRYLYNLENVDLYPVFCNYKESSHVAGKAFIDGVEVYFDPELDHRFMNHNNFMISKDEFQRNHDILFYRDNFDIIIEVKNKVRSR